MLQRTYIALALLATGPLVACAERDVFDRVGAPATPVAADAAWPKLADAPPAPPVGVYTPAAPDPATGAATQIELAVAAEIAEARRQAIKGPVK